MARKAGVVNVFATHYENWSQRDATFDEALDRVNNKGLSLVEALRVKDKLMAVVSTHFEAAARILRQHADNGMERHIDEALDSSIEYCNLRGLMPPDEPEALSSYQGEFSEDGWAMADQAIKTYGVEIAEGQFLFHGGRWASNNSTVTTSRPFSTSFCPQVALRNAQWRGKAYDAGRVDLMVVRVTRPKTKAFAYSLKGNHGNEKEVVFASGATLTCVRKTYIADIPVSRVTSGIQRVEKNVPAYVIEVEIS
ncbi:hypothetical protein [Caballeronia sp. TF1N1]|uniref:hypothetical protein n=1 Tax=Caballeronia sp. TF1N1 TaxID=2878153 RepID=UPI001FD41D03|nr:hypothetical protein [Caballeronia sp. TF1N1]